MIHGVSHAASVFSAILMARPKTATSTTVGYTIKLYALSNNASCAPDTEMPNTHAEFVRLAMVSDGRGSVFFFGGWTGSDSTDDTFQYDMTTAVWTQKQSMGAKRASHTVVQISEDEFLLSGKFLTQNTTI